MPAFPSGSCIYGSKLVDDFSKPLGGEKGERSRCIINFNI
jgi:hypothetical protein